MAVGDVGHCRVFRLHYYFAPQSMKHLRPPVGLRDDRVREATVLLLLAGLTTALFSWLPIDITVARFFFRANDAGHWPLARLWPWSWSNRLAPFVTVSLLTLGFFALLLG